MPILNSPTLIHGDSEYNTQMLYFTSSSLNHDDTRIYMISDKSGSPNVFVMNLNETDPKMLTNNTAQTMKSYVYFGGDDGKGLSKASVSLDGFRDVIYYIQDNNICKVDMHGNIQILNKVPNSRMTAFTHVSTCGTRLCVPMTDGRCLDFDPKTEGYGIDSRPVYDIDERVQKENLNSYICVYDTTTGELLHEKTVPKCWITHVQFNPCDCNVIMFNHEWSCFDCGIRRIWIYDILNNDITAVRTEKQFEHGYSRSRNDWVCHEVWSSDGTQIFYHGAYEDNRPFVGLYDLKTKEFSEIALQAGFTAYGHFTTDSYGNFTCDGYYRDLSANEVDKLSDTKDTEHKCVDPHIKDSQYISKVIPDWKNGTLTWFPLCLHNSDWTSQDAHPHPIYNNKGDKIYFSSRNNSTVKVYCINV